MGFLYSNRSLTRYFIHTFNYIMKFKKNASRFYHCVNIIKNIKRQICINASVIILKNIFTTVYYLDELK